MTENQLNIRKSGRYTGVSAAVFAPASVANMACGYDILGFALERPGDRIVARFSDAPGLRIVAITGAEGKLPYAVEKNTAGFAAARLLEHLGEKRGIELEIHKQMPFGSGLGSSAASAAGAVAAINELLGKPLAKTELLPFAVLGEQVADGAYHADNVAPSLLGGIVLIRSNAELDVLSLPVPPELYAAVLYPHVKILTRSAREILRPEVPLAQHIEQTGNLGGLITALFTNDYELIGRSLRDVVIEPQRAQLIPHFGQAQMSAMEAGALGCSISGAGPSIFALCRGQKLAKKVGRAMFRIFSEAGVNSDLFLSPINAQGTQPIETGP